MRDESGLGHRRGVAVQNVPIGIRVLRVCGERPISFVGARIEKIFLEKEKNYHSLCDLLTDSVA